MSKKEPECQIVVDKARDGVRKVFLRDPVTGRQAPMGDVADNRQLIENKAKQLAEINKRNGNRVSYREE